eukprot:gene11768-15747_t
MQRREEFILDLYKFRSVNSLLEFISDQTSSPLVLDTNNNKNGDKKNNSVKPVTMKSISSIKTCHTSNQRESTSPIYQIYFSDSLDSGDGDMFLCKIGWVLPCEVYECMQCKLTFDRYNCKQHCYACGEIVCQNCCKHLTILKSCGYLSSNLLQVCNLCFESKGEDGIVAIGRSEEAINNSPVASSTVCSSASTGKHLFWSNYLGGSSNTLLTPLKTVLYNRQNQINSLVTSLQPEATYSSTDNIESEENSSIIANNDGVDDTNIICNYSSNSNENYRNNDLLNRYSYVRLSSIMSFHEELENICSVDVCQTQIDQHNPSEFYSTKRVSSLVDYGNIFASHDTTLSYSKSFINPNYISPHISYLSNPIRVNALTNNNISQNKYNYFISNSDDDKCNELLISYDNNNNNNNNNNNRINESKNITIISVCQSPEDHANEEYDNIFERYFISDISPISEYEYSVSSPSSVVSYPMESKISLTSDLSSALEYCNSLFSSHNSQTVGSSIGDNESNYYGDKTTRKAMLKMPYDVSELLYFDSNQNHQIVSNNDNITASSIDTNSSNYNDHLPLLTLASLSIKDQFESSNIHAINNIDMLICEEGQLHHRNNYNNNSNINRKSHYSDTGRTDSESIRTTNITVSSNTTNNNQINKNENDIIYNDCNNNNNNNNNGTLSERSSVSSTISDMVENVSKLSKIQFMLYRATTAPRALIGWQIEFRLPAIDNDLMDSTCSDCSLLDNGLVTVGVVTDIRKDKITNHTEFRIELSDVHKYDSKISVYSENEHKSPYLWLSLQRGKQNYGIEFKPIQKVLGHFDENGRLHPTLLSLTNSNDNNPVLPIKITSLPLDII